MLTFKKQWYKQEGTEGHQIKSKGEQIKKDENEDNELICTSQFILFSFNKGNLYSVIFENTFRNKNILFIFLNQLLCTK